MTPAEAGAEAATPLGAILHRRIAAGGPITVEEYMGFALGHPEHGYYMTGDPLGRGGDFVTAPEISQVFGELIGLWAAVVWQQLGAPARVVLAEFGPGRGTLLRDALRAARTVPGFAAALEVHLVETSPALRARQRETLAGAGLAPAAWHDSIDGLPAGSVIAVANEFLDALPVRQLVWTGAHWAERVVDSVGGRLVWRTGPPAETDGISLPPEKGLAPGAIFETCPAALDFAAALGGRIATGGGAALLIDYGHVGPAAGETLQAVRRHAYADPLAAPGAADLTAHVDFAAIAKAAAGAGAACHGPAGQGRFLAALGARERTDRLCRDADADAAALLRSGLDRLIGEDQMGTLFKVLAVTAAGAPAPPGFES